MKKNMTTNDRQGTCARTLEGTKGLRNTPRSGHSLRRRAELKHRDCERRRGAGSGPRTGALPFKYQSGHGQSERTRSEASPTQSPGRRFRAAKAGLGTPPETPYVAVRLRRGGLLTRLSLLGRATRLLAAVLALAVPLLAVLVLALSDAAPAQAQANQPTPGKPVLTLRKWPHPYIPEIVVAGNPPRVVVLGHYELSWPKIDAGGLLLHYQFAAGKPEHIKIPPDRFSNINDAGEIYEYVRVIGPRDGVRTIWMRGKNYLANDCEGTGPCEGAGEWSDPPLIVMPDPPGLPLRQVEAPTIPGSLALSDSGSDGTWTAGATVEVTLTFSEAVTVDTTGGTPSIGLDLGGTESRRAPYLRGSGTTALVFAYTLTDADGSHTSMLVPIDSLALNGGTIRSQATSADAALGHSGVAKAGSMGGLGNRGDSGAQDEGDAFTARFRALPQNHNGSDAFTFELHFSEAPEGLSYTTVAGGLLDVTGATVNKARRLTAGSNLGWEVTMTPSQSGDITIRLPARACTDTNAVCVGGSPLGEAVSATVPRVPFTASFSGVPAEHDGTAFDIRFHLSAEPAGLSFRTVQNGLFDVTGGSIEKASRLNAGKNNGWTLRIDPSGFGDVTVRVKPTTACDTAPECAPPTGASSRAGSRCSSQAPRCSRSRMPKSMKPKAHCSISW